MFDLKKIRIDPSSQIEPVERILTRVPVKKPGKQSFVRVHPSEEFRINVGLIIIREPYETYLVSQELTGELAEDITPTSLLTTVDKFKQVFLWPIKLPDCFGKLDPWNESATVAASRARDAWVKVTSNRSIGSYEVYEAKGDLGEPEWPNKSFQELIYMAFADYFIDSLNHPIVKRLRGEV